MRVAQRWEKDLQDPSSAPGSLCDLVHITPSLSLTFLIGEDDSSTDVLSGEEDKGEGV